jgi:hypothetical protein
MVDEVHTETPSQIVGDARVEPPSYVGDSVAEPKLVVA